MSIAYVAVNWNRQKRIYDSVLLGGVAALIGGFFLATRLTHPNLTVETGLIRGLGVTALILLHVILCIGPLCRLDSRFLPLLYNRRHLGVTMAAVALGHAGFALFQFHALGDVNPLVSLLTANGAFGSVAGFPFELLGLAALLMLILMAATSHDYWLSVLTPAVWKSLHMLVYVAYALLIGHVALGSLQAESGPALPVALAGGAILVIGLHLAAGLRERRADRAEGSTTWVPVCRVDEIPERRARIGVVGGERVAVFRYDGKLSCISNVCRHQNGPLGEGKIVDGCVTCPWHGYQYAPDNGTSPPPFNDKVATYDLRVEDGVVLVRAEPHPAGTRVPPVNLVPVREDGGDPGDEFYIGYLPASSPASARHTRRAVATIGAIAGGVVLSLALAQKPFAASTFEYGHPRRLSGHLVPGPYPTLEVQQGQGVTRYFLAAAGKHGAAAATTALTGRRVEVLGTLIRRGNRAMLEIAGVEPLADSAAGTAPVRSDLGRFTLAGEIVDSKCWLGVMNPGEGKTHLACAVRCLSGGLTPLFVIRDGSGREQHLVLTGANGEPMPRSVLPSVGRPVSISGRVVREDDVFFIQSAPSEIRVLQ